MSAFMLIDCGTTNLRVVLTDEDGKVLAREKRPGGGTACAQFRIRGVWILAAYFRGKTSGV